MQGLRLRLKGSGVLGSRFMELGVEDCVCSVECDDLVESIQIININSRASLAELSHFRWTGSLLRSKIIVQFLGSGRWNSDLKHGASCSGWGTTNVNIVQLTRH